MVRFYDRAMRPSCNGQTPFYQHLLSLMTEAMSTASMWTIRNEEFHKTDTCPNEYARIPEKKSVGKDEREDKNNQEKKRPGRIVPVNVKLTYGVRRISNTVTSFVKQPSLSRFSRRTGKYNRAYANVRGFRASSLFSQSSFQLEEYSRHVCTTILRNARSSSAHYGAIRLVVNCSLHHRVRPSIQVLLHFLPFHVCSRSTSRFQHIFSSVLHLLRNTKRRRTPSKKGIRRVSGGKEEGWNHATGR